MVATRSRSALSKAHDLTKAQILPKVKGFTTKSPSKMKKPSLDRVYAKTHKADGTLKVAAKAIRRSSVYAERHALPKHYKHAASKSPCKAGKRKSRWSGVCVARCPGGEKRRSRVTRRCMSPCKSGWRRSRSTNRCHKLA